MVAKTDRKLHLDLVQSLSSSSLLEHQAKTTAPHAAAAAACAAAGAAAAAVSATEAANAPAAAPSTTASSGPISTSGAPRMALQDVLVNLLDMLLPRDGPLPSLRAVLSGPCLEYFAAAQAVSQLHAADGGPLYGLPSDALMQPMPAVIAAATAGEQRQEEEQQPQAQQHMLHINTLCVECSIVFWKTCLSQDPPVPLRPLRRRHLVALCLRAACVALDSRDVHKEEVGQQGQQHEQQQQQEHDSGQQVSGKG